MGMFFDGHDTKNEDLFGPVQGGMNDQDLYSLGGQGPRPVYDPGGNLTGYDYGFAGEEAQRYLSNAIGYRTGVEGRPDMRQATQYMGYGDQSRGDQGRAVALMGQAAMGQAPSVAQQQMQMGNDQAMRNQLAMAGSARGAGAMGSAYYNAAQNMGNLQAQNNAQMGLLRAQEMEAARNAYFQGATGMRGQDYGAAGMVGNWAEQDAARNAEYGLAYDQMRARVYDSQRQAYENLKGMQEGHWGTQSNLDQRSQDRQDQWTRDYLSSMKGLAGGGKI